MPFLSNRRPVAKVVALFLIAKLCSKTLKRFGGGAAPSQLRRILFVYNSIRNFAHIAE